MRFTDNNRRIPVAGDWPCQATAEDVPPRLKHALYVLLRDHVQPGLLEEVCIQVEAAAVDTVFTNKHIEGNAEALAAFLTGGEG